jgi:hypothetical protein
MDDPGRVHGAEGIAKLLAEGDDGVGRHRAVAKQPLAGTHSREKLHGEEWLSPDFTHFEYFDDVGMADGSQRPGFTGEPDDEGFSLAIRKKRGEDKELQCHPEAGDVVRRLAEGRRLIDDAHGAAAYLPLDTVMTEQIAGLWERDTHAAAFEA